MSVSACGLNRVESHRVALLLGEECSVSVSYQPTEKEWFPKTSLALGSAPSRHERRHLAWSNVVNSGAHVLGQCCMEAVVCALKEGQTVEV